MWPASPGFLTLADAGPRVLGSLHQALPEGATGPVVLMAGGLAALVLFVLSMILGLSGDDPRPETNPPSVNLPPSGSGPARTPGSDGQIAPEPSPSASEPPAQHGADATELSGGPPAEQGARDWADVMEMGRIAARDLEVETLEDVLDAATEAGLGEPEIITQEAGRTIVSLQGCRTCRRGGPVASVDGCPFEAGFLEAGVDQIEPADVTALESDCALEGGDACEFELWH